MKKILILLVLAILCITLLGCTETTTPNDSPTTQTDNTETGFVVKDIEACELISKEELGSITGEELGEPILLRFDKGISQVTCSFRKKENTGGNYTISISIMKSLPETIAGYDTSQNIFNSAKASCINPEDCKSISGFENEAYHHYYGNGQTGFNTYDDTFFYQIDGWSENGEDFSEIQLEEIAKLVMSRA